MKKLNVIILVLIQLGALLLTACGRMGPVPPADKTPPVVNTTSPQDGVSDFPVTGTIMISFSKQMDSFTINESTVPVISEFGDRIAGSFTTTDTISVFTPAQPLNEHTTYTVTVSTGVKDSSGIAMTGDHPFSFKTLSFPPPKVVDIQPVNRAKNVGLNTAISIQFSEPMDPSSITGTNIKVSYANGDFSGSVSYNEALGAATFYPDIRFASNTTYAVTVTTGVTDLGKTPLTDAFVSSIKTGVANDSTAPTVLSTYPSNTTNISVNTPISVTFSEPMDLSTITPSNFIVSQGTATIPGDIKNYGNTVVFTPTNPLAYLTPYTATITMGATDLAGIPLVNNNNTWQFTTGLQSPDTVQPSVLATWPTSTQNNVPVYRQVVALFSESMLASSITPTTFVLVDQNDPNKVPVPGQVKTNGAAAIFIPSQNLAYNTTYTAMIISTTTLGATDLAGNSLRNGNSPAGYTWNFTTEAPASFTITATAGPNGSISPAGSVAVNINNSQTFTITPATGYYINDVLVDGTSVGAVSSYTFSGVTDDHTISASFAINTFTITTSVATSGTGTVTPVNPSVNYGASQTLTFLPATGYHVSAVTVDSTPLSAPLPSSYTFSNVTANHTIVVSFAINTYTVTPSVVGGNGTISPNTAQMVNYNGTTSFTLTPAGGYNIVTPVGGTCPGTLSGNTYTTNPITGNCTVIASYVANIYALVHSRGQGILGLQHTHMEHQLH
jgi:predicted small lipoprotein YifL